MDGIVHAHPAIARVRSILFRTRITTLPEFLERRYSPASRSFLAFMAIVAALFIHIGMSLYAGAAVFQRFFGINVVTSIVIISTVVGIYTVLGGLEPWSSPRPSILSSSFWERY